MDEKPNTPDLSAGLRRPALTIFLFLNLIVFPFTFLATYTFMDVQILSQARYTLFYWLLIACIDAALFFSYLKIAAPIKEFEKAYSEKQDDIPRDELEKHWKGMTEMPFRLAVLTGAPIAVIISAAGLLLHVLILFDLRQSSIVAAVGVWLGAGAAIAVYVYTKSFISRPLNIIYEISPMPWGGKRLTVTHKLVALALIISSMPALVLTLQAERLNYESLRKLYKDSVMRELEAKAEILKVTWAPGSELPNFVKKDSRYFLTTTSAEEAQGGIRLWSFEIALPDYFAVDIGNGFMLARKTDPSEWKGYSTRMAAITFLLGAVIMLVGVGAAIVFGRGLKDTARRLETNTRDISKDQAFRYKHVTLYSDDETDGISGAINELLGAIQKQFGRIESLLDKVREAVAILGSSTAEMRAVSDHQAGDSQSQAGRVNELAGTGAEIASTAAQISEKSASVKEASEKTLEFCREGIKRIESAVSQIGEANQRADEMVGRMKSLEQRFEEIQKVIVTITEVSDRTELISLNAALEAAGAKKYGKRFGVVSMEVKRLAVLIRDMTNEIHHHLESLREALRETAYATRESAKAVEEGVGGVTIVRNNLRQLSDTAERTYTSAIEINVSTKEQTLVSEKLADTLREMNDLARQVALGAEESKRAIEDISQIALSLNDILWSSDSQSQ